MPTRLRAVLGTAGAAALILLSLSLGSPSLAPTLDPEEPHVERYETQRKTLVFDFNSTQSQTSTLTLDMTLGPAELDGMEKAELFLKMKQTRLIRYPDSASGSLDCAVRILINDEQWFRTNVGHQYQAGKPEEWENREEAVQTSYDYTLPYTFEKAVATDDLNKPGDNHVHATVTCTNRVDSTGPMWAVITMGPLYAVVAT